MAPQLSPPPTPTTPVAVAHAAIFYIQLRESPSKTMENAFYFI